MHSSRQHSNCQSKKKIVKLEFYSQVNYLLKEGIKKLFQTKSEKKINNQQTHTTRKSFSQNIIYTT